MSDLHNKIYANKSSPPYAWIQFKGSYICADIHCSCGKLLHIDAEFSYYVKCPHCEQIYGLCGDIKLIPITQIEFNDSGVHKSCLIIPDKSEIYPIGSQKTAAFKRRMNAQQQILQKNFAYRRIYSIGQMNKAFKFRDKGIADLSGIGTISDIKQKLDEALTSGSSKQAVKVKSLKREAITF